MVPRNTALLALLVAALGAFVYYHEIRGGEERAEAEAAAKRLFGDIEASDIQSLALETSDGKSARLERRDGAWQLLEPVSFPADGAAVDALVSGLAQLASEAVYDEPAPLADYGLEGEPVVRFRVGESEHRLTLGDASPVGGNTYVATETEGKVYAVPTYRTSTLRKTLDDLRDRRVLRFEREAIQRLRVRWPGSGVLLERSEGAWRLREPVEDAADEDTVDALLSDLEYLRAAGFVDEAPPDAALGLAPAQLEVELYAEGEKPVARLAVGGLQGDDQHVVRGFAPGSLYRVAADRLESLPRRVGAYRFKELARFDSDRATRFEIVFYDPSAGQTAVVEGRRDESGWTTHPETMQPGVAESLVEALAALEAEDIEAESATVEELETLELSPARVAFRVFAGEDASDPLAQVELGRADPERGIAARSVGDPRVYRLDFDLGETLPLGLEAFRNRFVDAPPPAPAEDPLAAP